MYDLLWFCETQGQSTCMHSSDSIRMFTNDTSVFITEESDHTGNSKSLMTRVYLSQKKVITLATRSH